MASIAPASFFGSARITRAEKVIEEVIVTTPVASQSLRPQAQMKTRACFKNRSVTVGEGFFVGMKAIFRRNTLCISRKIDKMTAEKTRRGVRYRFFKQAPIIFAGNRIFGKNSFRAESVRAQASARTKRSPSVQNLF